MKISNGMSLTYTEYAQQYDWGESFIQGGSKGIVFRSKKDGGSYTTAFFEAFPKEPKTFIRGEGETIEEAETDCWKKYQKILSCPEHEFERRGYVSGAGFCIHCNMFKSNCFDPLTKCMYCDTPTNFTYVFPDGTENEEQWVCEDCFKQVPLYLWRDEHWYGAKIEDENRDFERLFDL